MQEKAIPASPNQLREALARDAYRQDRIRIEQRDVAGFDCLATSRQGLYAVARGGAHRLLIHGLFFGICRDGDVFYLFESGGSPHVDTRTGRLVRFRLRDGRIGDERVIARELPNGCHQLAVLGGLLCLVDTDDQTVWRFDRDGTAIDIKRPLASADIHHHPNSIAPWQGGALILLHNGAYKGTNPSELVWCDEDWIERRRTALPGRCCHDIVADEAGVLWHCGSMAGELINSEGLGRKVSDLMTRGLIVTRDMFVVGASEFGRRSVRDDLGGTVTFLDRAFRPLSEIMLPVGPAQLVLL